MTDQFAAPVDLDLDDVAAEIARHHLKRHEFAALVRLHSGYLGELLNRRRRLTPEVAERIAAAVRTLRKPRA